MNLVGLDKIGRQLRHFILGCFPAAASSSAATPAAAAASGAAPAPRPAAASRLQQHGVRFLHQLVELGVAVDAALRTCLLSRELALPVSIFHLTEKETEY